jgi:DNA-binding winged helix-turn-helix (wHTH) protein
MQPHQRSHALQLDLREERIFKEGRELRLRSKPFSILRYLAGHPHRLVSRDELVEAVWGRVAMSESVLRTHLWELRRILGANIIETVAGRGYRFVADVAFGVRLHKEKRAMSKHVTISSDEAADRLAIRELVEAYAHCADRRDAKGQMALFTDDTHFVVYMGANDPTPTQELHSRDALAPVFADLNKYAATMHFLGQSTILSLAGDRATGEVYCMAQHLTVEGGARSLMIAALRYADKYVKQDGVWLYAERLLYVDWIEQRALS